MARGIARTEPGRLNSNQAIALAKRIRQDHPDWWAVRCPLAQGLAVVHVTLSDGRKVTVRNEREYTALNGGGNG